MLPLPAAAQAELGAEDDEAADVMGQVREHLGRHLSELERPDDLVTLNRLVGAQRSMHVARCAARHPVACLQVAAACYTAVDSFCRGAPAVAAERWAVQPAHPHQPTHPPHTHTHRADTDTLPCPHRPCCLGFDRWET